MPSLMKEWGGDCPPCPPSISATDLDSSKLVDVVWDTYIVGWCLESDHCIA